VRSFFGIANGNEAGPLRRNLGRERVLFFELVRTKGRETKENRSANSGERTQCL
jgi:hypothetical protein